MTEIENVLLRQLTEQTRANEDLARQLTDLTRQVETLKWQLAMLPALFGKYTKEGDGVIERQGRARKPSKPPVGYLRKCAARGVPDAAELSRYGTRIGERSQTATPVGRSMPSEPPCPAKERGGGWER